VKDFIVSCVSLLIILAVIWGAVSVMLLCSNSLTKIGVPLELTWFLTGLYIHHVKPANSITTLSQDVWFFVDKSASRFS